MLEVLLVIAFWIDRHHDSQASKASSLSLLVVHFNVIWAYVLLAAAITRRELLKILDKI